MLNIAIFADLIIAIIFFVLVGLMIYRMYKHDPAKTQRAIKAQNHEALLKALQIAKSLAHTEVINIAKDENLPSGAAKKSKAVKDVLNGLSLAGFNHIPEVMVARIVEASYQTLAQFIQDNHLDSRDKKTPLPDQLNPSELKKRLP